MRDRDRDPPWGPADYWHIGPVYVRKPLVLLAVILLSAAVLLLLGPPFHVRSAPGARLPVYRYDDPRLAAVDGLAQVLDGEGRVRYEGEVAAGAYTGRGKVFDPSGALLYDGPLVDGVYEGGDAAVYRDGVLVYAGDMAGNLYEGQGRRLDPATGIVSEGQFSKGRLEGQGQEFYPSGALLREGTFSRDLLEGQGAEYAADGVLLREGTFSAGLLHGEGREYAASGALRYEGQFWRGLYHGQGLLYHAPPGVPSAEGTFVYGRLAGRGVLYHPSGQPLYTGLVCGERPRADAFLGLSLAEVEAAFSLHWQLYSWEGITAFVYPYFQLMFITESPVELVSPVQAAEAIPDEAGGPAQEQPAVPAGERLSPDTDPRSVVVSQVLSYGQPLPCAAQPEDGCATGRHPPGWREWFSHFAQEGTARGAAVRQTGPFVWRFAADPLSGPGGDIDELWAEKDGVETMTARREDKDMTLWYQTARWREEP